PVTVAGGDTVVVDLELNAQAVGLSEIVVTGYGTQRAGNITGAVTQVSSAEFNTGRVITPQALIQGKVAGVQVVDNNEPGGGLKIRIRGATSVNASSDPLYVIDGMPVTSTLSAGRDSLSRDALNFLNPDDIESISTERLSLGMSYEQLLLNDNLVVKTNVRGARSSEQFQAGDVLGNAVAMAPTQPVLDPTNPTGYWDWPTTGASASNPVGSL